MDNQLSKLLGFYKSRNFVRAEKEYLNIAKKVKPNHELLNLYGVILFELKKFKSEFQLDFKTFATLSFLIGLSLF